MTNKLQEITLNLRKAIDNNKLTQLIVYEKTQELSILGYKYDYESFPVLKNTDKFIDLSQDTPINLAEALLWKLGKWKAYKKFTDNYANESSIASRTDVVFHAYAKHLRNKDNPIYDQHALRALWVICSNFTDDEKDKCKSVLFDSKNKWKQTGSGKYSVECYDLFVKHINVLTKHQNSPTKTEIDRLLMPLGQAIKKNTSSYEAFCKFCQWSDSGN